VTLAIQYLFGLFLFTFPFSIRFLVYEAASYRFGNFNPWVTGFVYLPELLLLAIFVLWFIQKIQQKEDIEIKSKPLWWLLGLFVLNALIVTLIKGDSVLAALFVLRAFEALVVYLLVTERILSAKTMVRILLTAAFVQVVWGFFQWQLNHSLGLTVLGESILGPDVLGVAKIDLPDGTKHIRAYGSFLHPNILAGYLVAIFFMVIRYLKYSQKLFWLAFFALGIYLTNSEAAMVVGGAALILYVVFSVFNRASFRKVIVLLTLLVVALVNVWFFKNSEAVMSRDFTLQERLSQNILSQQMLRANPLGVGVNQYTLELEKVSDEKLLPWEFQPVHNAYFLILNEVGIQGLLLLVIAIVILYYRYWYNGKAVALLALILLAPFDHFLWDSWVGFILIALAIGFFTIENEHHLLSRKD